MEDKNIKEKREEAREQRSEKGHLKDARRYAREYFKELKKREEEERKKKGKEEAKRRAEEITREREKPKEKPKREITEEETAEGENASKPKENEEKIKSREDKLKGKKKEIEGEQILGLKVEKTKIGNAVFINIKAIRDIEDCVVVEYVPLKEVEIEAEGAEKIEEDGKTVIRWHAGKIEKGSEITLEYKVYKKTRRGIMYGINLTKEKLPPVKVAWKEKGEIERRIEKVIEERKKREEAKKKQEIEISEEPEPLSIEDITLQQVEEIAHEKKAAEPEVKEKKKKLIEEKPEKEEKKKLEEIETPELDKLINKAVILAIIIGIGVTIALIYYTGQESYSDLYIYPDSYSNYVEGNTVSFTYGVRSFEIAETRYELKVFLGDELVNQKEFVLEKGGKKEETLSIDVPDNTEFPVKVRVVCSMNGRENSVHFWLKERK